MKEIFKDIPGWEGRYQASNLGQIKSLGNDKARKDKILKPRKWNYYDKIVLCKDGERYFYHVHVLVWSAFNGPVPDGLEIDHIDGNPANNRLENLRAVSHATNMLNPVTVERREKAAAKRIVPEDEKRKKRNEWARDYYHRTVKVKNQLRKEEAHRQMLESLGMTEEEYLNKREAERKERHRAYNKEYYISNKEKHYIAAKKWKDAHREEVKEYHRQYWEENKHKYRVNNVS